MRDSIRSVVAAALRAEMARQQINQRALAARVGKSQNWVFKRASGRTACDVEDLAMLADALGLTIYDLLPEPERAA